MYQEVVKELTAPARTIEMIVRQGTAMQAVSGTVGVIHLISLLQLLPFIFTFQLKFHLNVFLFNFFQLMTNIPARVYVNVLVAAKQAWLAGPEAVGALQMYQILEEKLKVILQYVFLSGLLMLEFLDNYKL